MIVIAQEIDPFHLLWIWDERYWCVHWQANVSHSLFIMLWVFFFRVEWEEKGFLGLLAQKELRWIKSVWFIVPFHFSKYKTNTFVMVISQVMVDLCLQGEPGITGKVGLMGERVRISEITTSRFEYLYLSHATYSEESFPFIHPTLTFHVSGFGWFYRTCGRGRTGRREGKNFKKWFCLPPLPPNISSLCNTK